MNKGSGGLPKRAGRRDRTIQEQRHDAYKAKGKPQEPTACPQCGVLFQRGRWVWGEKPSRAREVLCPACRRINDQYPAGEVTVTGTFYAGHRAEVLALARNEEAREKAEHPLARIMQVRDADGGAVIATTDTHLARRIGEALHHAYQGELDLQYGADQQFVRAKWTR